LDGLHKPDATYEIKTMVRNFYDAADRLVRKQDVFGYETTYEYDEAGNLIAVTDANGVKTRTVFDPAGQVTAVIDGNGLVRGFVYDELGRKVKEVTPRGHETRYSYDNNGNRTVKRNSGGTSVQNCEFNQKNEVSRIRTSGDDQIRSFAFDPNGYRIAKGVEGTSSRTHYFLEGEHLDAVYDQDNQTVSCIKQST